MTKDEALKWMIDNKKLESQYPTMTYEQGFAHGYEAHRVEQALEQPTQRNFCERCGKRASKDPYHIHTCTPPQALKEKKDE